jgi:hypothetical protein
VGTARAAATAAKTQDGAAQRRASADSQWYAMDSAHGGVAWRDLPEHYGPWRSVASRFYRWRESGVWDRALLALQVQANAEGRLVHDHFSNVG